MKSKVIVRGDKLEISKGPDGKYWIRDIGDERSTKLFWFDHEALRLFIGGIHTVKDGLIINKIVMEYNEMGEIE